MFAAAAAAQGHGQLAAANYSQATLASRRPAAAAAAAIHRDGGCGAYYNGASHNIDTGKADRDYVKSAIHRLLTTPDLSATRAHGNAGAAISDRALEDAAKAFQVSEANAFLKEKEKWALFLCSVNLQAQRRGGLAFDKSRLFYPKLILKTENGLEDGLRTRPMGWAGSGWAS